MLLLGVTGFGDAELVTLKSNWPAEATVTFTVELFPDGFGSGVEVEVLAVLVMTVPDAALAETVTIRVNVVVAPEGSDAMVQLTAVPGAGQTRGSGLCERNESGFGRNRVRKRDAAGGSRAVIMHGDRIGDVVAGLHGIGRSRGRDDDVSAGRRTHDGQHARDVVREIGIVGAGRNGVSVQNLRATHGARDHLNADREGAHSGARNIWIRAVDISRAADRWRRA